MLTRSKRKNPSLHPHKYLNRFRSVRHAYKKFRIYLEYGAKDFFPHAIYVSLAFDFIFGLFIVSKITHFYNNTFAQLNRIKKEIKSPLARTLLKLEPTRKDGRIIR